MQLLVSSCKLTKNLWVDGQSNVYWETFRVLKKEQQDSDAPGDAKSLEDIPREVSD